MTSERVATATPAWLQHRATGAVLSVLAVCSAVGAYVLSAQAGESDGSRRTLLLICGAACAAGVVLLGGLIQLRDRARIRTATQAAVDAQEALTIALNGALAPITSSAGS